MANANFDSIAATTIDNYVENTLADNIFKNHALFYKLKEMGRFKPVDGGKRIVIPVALTSSDTVQSYSGMTALTIHEQDPFTAAEFAWKEVAGTITISDRNKNINSGSKVQIMNFLEALIENCEDTLTESFVTQSYSDGTGNGSLDITGLGAMVLATGVYGGIDSAVDTAWQAYVDATVEALSLDDMRTAHLKTLRGRKGKADLILTDDTLFKKYESLNTPFLRYTNTKLADAKFENLRFGTADVVYDESCTAGSMFFLSTLAMYFCYHPDAFFKKLGPVRANNQTGEVYIIRLMGNLACKQRKKHSLLSNKTA